MRHKFFSTNFNQRNTTSHNETRVRVRVGFFFFKPRDSKWNNAHRKVRKIPCIAYRMLDLLLYNDYLFLYSEYWADVAAVTAALLVIDGYTTISPVKVSQSTNAICFFKTLSKKLYPFSSTNSRLDGFVLYATKNSTKAVTYQPQSNKAISLLLQVGIPLCMYVDEDYLRSKKPQIYPRCTRK